MSSGVCKVILIGNLGKDPEVKYLPSGSAVASISVATSESWTDKQTGQKQERTEWHRVVFFNRLAEIAGEHLKKGSKVYIEGALRTRKWQDNNNQDRYTTEIIANNMQMLDSRTGSQGQQNQQQPQRGLPPEQAMQGAHPGMQSGQQDQQQPQQGSQGGEFSDFDDDIPF